MAIAKALNKYGEPKTTLSKEMSMLANTERGHCVQETLSV
jgi:hypothetical protein